MPEYAALDELRAKLDSHRPLDERGLQAIREKFQLEWTYNSNALEGNPLTLSETSFFIREGLTSKGKPLSAYLEAKNHMGALDFLQDVVRNKTLISLSLIKQFHAILFKRIDYLEIKTESGTQKIRVEAGKYKEQNNHVVRLDGDIKHFTDHLQVPGEMEKLISWYVTNKTALHPVELAAKFHHKLVSIHPFTDGNGRLSRLFMNVILMQVGYTPAIILIEEKQRYLEALQGADDGNYEPFFGYLEELVSKTLTQTIDVIEGRDAFSFQDLSKMFRNILVKTKEIEQDLGPAIRTPEERGRETAQKILNIINDVLYEQAKALSTPELAVSFVKRSSLQAGEELKRVKSTLQKSEWLGPVSELQIIGKKRFIPALQVTFILLFGRYQVALLGLARIGRLNENNAEGMAEAGAKDLLGSLYFDDWDPDTIRTFVLDTLKVAIKKWDSEIEARKSAITQEETQVQQFREPSR